MTDFRRPEERRETFLRFYAFHLRHKAHPGMVYSLLPAIADRRGLDRDGRAWLAWLNGNTQNPVTSAILLDASDGDWKKWRGAVGFWNENFAAMDWDTDRRHQKPRFGVATEKWVDDLERDGMTPAWAWENAGDPWEYARSQPYFGRLSAWSGMEFARILLGGETIPDMGTLLLDDRGGSKSHRNGLAIVDGWDAAYWSWGDVADLGLLPRLKDLGEDLLLDARERTGHPDVSRMTLESALCTYKSWHKPNRRYPGVYADMLYERIQKGLARFPGETSVKLILGVWESLPGYLREDPGVKRYKQNRYLETGVPYLWEHIDD